MDIQNYSTAHRKPLIYFMHIPKTAGTTFKTILGRHFAEKETVELYGRTSFERFLQTPETEKANLKLAFGHVGISIKEHLPQPFSFITFLREPVARTLSYYYFARKHAHLRHHEAARKMPLHDFCEYYLIDLKYNNLLTRYLGSSEGEHLGGNARPTYISDSTLEQAKFNLDNYFSICGFAEQFDETLLLMRRTFGWQYLYYTMQNVSERQRNEEPKPETLEMIKQYNQLDQALYNYARRNFDQEIKKMGKAFQIELQSFKLLNRLYQKWVPMNGALGRRDLYLRNSVVTVARRLNPNIPLLNISNVQQTYHDPDIMRHCIDQPISAQLLVEPWLTISGWVICFFSKVNCVEVRCGTDIIESRNLNVPRPDVIVYFNLNQINISDEYEECGYSFKLNHMTLPRNFKLELYAKLENHETLHLGTIHTVR